MNLVNRIDILVMKTIVKPIINGIEKWTGFVPATLTYFIILVGLLSIPATLIPALIESSRYFGDTGGENIVISIFAIFNMLYLTHINKKAVCRWRLYLDKELETVNGSGIVHDPSRWKCFLLHMLVGAGILALPRFGAVTFPFIPMWFFWPALVTCGVQPYYAAKRSEQGKRIFRACATWIICFFLLGSSAYIRLSSSELGTKIFIISIFTTLAGLIIRILLRKNPAS
jgi:hypothetical protein